MTYPIENRIYMYNGNTVGVITQSLFNYVYIIIYYDDKQNSELKTVNWFDFVFHAKKTNQQMKKISTAY